MEKLNAILFKFLLVILIACWHVSLFSQPKFEDTLKIANGDSVTVRTYLKNASVKRLPDVEGTSVYAGKKTNLVYLDALPVSLSQNITRTAFAQIPGLTMWDMDGAGLQLNVGSRGTDSHRSIEMNMRQNGYNTNSDMFGYPEDHYTPPLQGIQRVQSVRGSAALQFGSQMGGMINFVMKEGDSIKPVAIESEQSLGSNNFLNSYNAIGGTSGKWNYYAYYDYRHGDGWRANAGFDYSASYLSVRYRFNSTTNLTFQFSRMRYVQQIAGGLNDLLFIQDPKQSLRSRNFFNPEINIPALVFKWNISQRTRLEIVSNVLFGQRNSVQFIASPIISDTVNTALGTYNPRQVDRDYYYGFTAEARVLHKWEAGKEKNQIAAGLRYSNGTTKRKQKGVGTTGNDFNLEIVKEYGTDLQFNTRNYALFAENIFQLSNDFSVTPGIRYEIINTAQTGKINNPVADVSYHGKRRFPLFGVGLQYQVDKVSQLYGNISQAYRPFLYANITPADRLDEIDQNLKDSKGIDIDLGYRGQYADILNFDLNGFYVVSTNKVGLITQNRTDGKEYLFTTNIGDAVTKGAEMYVEVSLLQSIYKRKSLSDIRLFNSLSYNHARYTNAVINKAGQNTDISGNKVENVPDWMNKTGLILRFKKISASIQHSYTAESYNDAFNTNRSLDGVTGLIPAYHLWDCFVNFNLLEAFHISASINNFTNERYFNRRITMYPGPGILPADGRTFTITLGVKL